MADTLTREKRSERMALIRAKNTRPEITVRKLIHGLGYRYRLHGRLMPGKPDLVFASRKKVIFVHGCFTWTMAMPSPAIPARAKLPTGCSSTSIRSWEQKTSSTTAWRMSPFHAELMMLKSSPATARSCPKHSAAMSRTRALMCRRSSRSRSRSVNG